MSASVNREEVPMTRNYGKMKALLKECKWYPVRPMRTFYEDGQLDKGWVESFCLGDWESGMPQGGICGGICPGEFIVGLFLGV